MKEEMVPTFGSQVHAWGGAVCREPRYLSPSTWGKVDPERLPDALIAYIDSTLAMPVITFMLGRSVARAVEKAVRRRAELLEKPRSGTSGQ